MTIQDNNGLNFSNPEKISEASLSSLLGLDFSSEQPKEPKEIKEVKEIKEEKVEEKKEEPTKVEESENADDLSLQETKEEETEDDLPIVKTIEFLYEKGIISDAYEGFDDEEDYTDDTLAKLLEHNFEKKLDEQLVDFVQSRSSLTQRILQYDVSSKGKDVESFLKTLVEEQNIRSLNPENEYDQEKILKEFYKNSGFNNQEIEERISDFKENNLLEKEAKRLKPKLDEFAQKIAEEKEKEQFAIKEAEDKVKDNYRKRVITELQKGEISGIKLNREEAGNLYSILTNEDVKLKMPGGKEVTMPALEAILFHHRYDQKGSLENVILATLLLTNPDKFQEQYAKKAKTEVTKTFMKEHSQNKKIKIGTSNEPRKEKLEEGSWILKH